MYDRKHSPSQRQSRAGETWLTLFPYQEEGRDFLASRKLALLADKPGLGKTAQAIAAADKIAANHILVICPAIGRIGWDPHREWKKWSVYGRNVHVVSSSKGLIPARSSVVISYDMAVRRLGLGSFPSTDFDLAIIDEAHFLKSPSAKRTVTVYGKGGLIRRAKRAWALTGTPMPNHPGELWTLLYTFGVTKLSYMDFIKEFCEFAPGSGPNDPMMQIIGAKKSSRLALKQLLSGIMLRRMREGNLPGLFFQNLPVECDNSPLSLPAEDLEKLQGFDNHPNPILLLEALAGSVSTLRRILGMRKAATVASIVKEELTARDYEKIVIFAVHKDVVKIIANELKEFNPVVVTGETPLQERVKNVDRFQEAPGCHVFIGNILAAGTAITLTAANEVLFAEQDWVPGNNAQAAQRCHRLGQTKNVRVRFASVADSLDEKIAGIVRRKTQDIAMVMGDQKDATLHENPAPNLKNVFDELDHDED